MKDSLTYHPSSQGWAPRVLPFLFYLLFIIACLLMFVYVWVGLGFFLSLLTSSYNAINMFFHVRGSLTTYYYPLLGRCYVFSSTINQLPT